MPSSGEIWSPLPSQVSDGVSGSLVCPSPELGSQRAPSCLPGTPKGSQLPSCQETLPTRGRGAWWSPAAWGAPRGDPDALLPLQSWEHSPCLRPLPHFPPRPTPATPQTLSLDSLKARNWGRRRLPRRIRSLRASNRHLAPFHSVLTPGLGNRGEHDVRSQLKKLALVW